MVSENYRLQFITHFNEHYSYIDSARLALEGGCRWIQLRMKGVENSLFEESAIVVQRLCWDYGATFIINDNVSVAEKIGADGVHLGKNDMSIAEARKVLGKKFVIGFTVNSFDDILSCAGNMAPDYFGCGPFRFTSTKQNLAPLLGCEGYRHIVQKMRDNNIGIPLVAIGGICRADVAGLLKCGVDGIAFSGCILNSANPAREMKDIADSFLTIHK